MLSTGPNALVIYGMFCRCLRGWRTLKDIRRSMSGTSQKCCLWDLLESVVTELQCSRFLWVIRVFTKPLSDLLYGVEYLVVRFSPLRAFASLNLFPSSCAFYTLEVPTSRPVTSSNIAYIWVARHTNFKLVCKLR